MSAEWHDGGTFAAAALPDAPTEAPPGNVGQTVGGVSVERIFELLERFEHWPTPEPAEEEAEPELLVPVERTPLPEVDHAMPVLSLLPGVVGRRRGRYKIALLKTLQADGRGRWKIRQIQDAVFWLEPRAVAELVRDLRDVEVLNYDPARATYRMSSNGRVISALVSALTSGIEPRRLIKYLSLTMSFALVGGGATAAKASFASAVGVLRSDLDELRRLIDDNSTSALREASELVEGHLQDMRELLDEHERFRLDSGDDPEFLRIEHDALTLTAELTDAVADVSLWLTGKANEVMRGGAPIDRSDVRDFVSEQPPAQLAALLDDLVTRPPFLLLVSANLAFDLLAEKSGLHRPVPPPLPEPAPPRRELPPPSRDPTRELIEELHDLVAATSATELVVQQDWQTSVARHNAFIDAYNRRGERLPPLELSTEVEEPRRAGVARISKTMIEAGQP